VRPDRLVKALSVSLDHALVAWVPGGEGSLFISPKVVERRVANIFDKLGLAPSDNDNRRVIVAIRFLES
jgi:hypothetical protein